jgi:hypothetical protein
LLNNRRTDKLVKLEMLLPTKHQIQLKSGIYLMPQMLAFRPKSVPNSRKMPTVASSSSLLHHKLTVNPKRSWFTQLHILLSGHARPHHSQQSEEQMMMMPLLVLNKSMGGTNARAVRRM